jgi:4'-phosphopantetheinyl transferase
MEASGVGRPDAGWQEAPAQLPPLSPAVVHVWAVRLDAPASQIDALYTTLSSDERERAGRFYFDRDRRRYICARGVLRLLLSRYLVEAPEAFAFSYGPNGKPALSGRFLDALTFNVSHSHELALVAIGTGPEMGVDVEAVRPLEDANDIASRFFSPREAERLRSLPDAARMDAFFECWTRKEAYLKALGSGLAKPLDAFEVTFATGDAPALKVYGDAAETARWRICDLSPAAGYTGALVTQGPAEVLCWEWAPDAYARCAAMAVEPVEAI